MHCLTVAPAFLAVTDNKQTGVSFGKWVTNVFFFFFLKSKIPAENKLERTTVQMSWSRQQTSKDFRICV